MAAKSGSASHATSEKKRRKSISLEEKFDLNRQSTLDKSNKEKKKKEKMILQKDDNKFLSFVCTLPKTDINTKYANTTRAHDDDHIPKEMEYVP